MVTILNYSYAHGSLSDTQRRGILRLLFKKDDPLELKNWRPISLLNTDYKICTKVLANRLRKVLPRIINKDQTCGIPDRSIYENLFLLRDTIDYVQHRHLSAAIISLDQEKAFDRVNHEFLHRVLSRFNFGPYFRRWVNVVYNNITSHVINNGWLSSPFRLERGVRQGCPLSPLLYCLVVETLGQAIRRDDTIEGIQIPGSNQQQSKVSQYADDTTLILANNYSITRCFHIVNIFEKGSGSRLNTTKTEGLWIGRSAGRQTGPVNITWVTDKLKILGLYFGHANLEHANWDPRLSKLTNRLNSWKQRTLSLRGKALITNILGASNLWYTASVYPMPEWVHTRVNTALYDFLWNSKTELVARTTCQLPLARGGLAVVHPQEKARALKLRWVPCIGDPTCDSKWVYFARFWIGLALSRKTKSWSFLRSNSVPKYIGGSPPLHYQHILTAIDRLNLDLSLLPDYNVKTFYTKLVNPPPRRLPCTLAWEGKLSTPLPWRDIWPGIYGGLSTNWEADIVWRLAHGVVKTRTFLHRWRRLRVNALCASCGLTESFSHAFCECTIAPRVWAWVFQSIHPFYSPPLTFSPALVFFGHGLPRDGQCGASNAVSRVIFNITLNELWAARNQRTFEQRVIPAQAVINKIKTRVRTRILAAHSYSSPRDFLTTWAHMNVLCRLDHNGLRVLI